MNAKEKQKLQEVHDALDGIERRINDPGGEGHFTKYEVEVSSPSFSGTVIIAVPDYVVDDGDTYQDEHRIDLKGRHQDSDDFEDGDFDYDDDYNEDDDPATFS